MDFKVLCVGDVVGNPGLDRLARSLRYLKRKTGADFVIVNGENASNLGMTPDQGEDIFDSGADVITMGNHTFSRREIVPYIEENGYVLRPANLPPQQPGRGWMSTPPAPCTSCSPSTSTPRETREGVCSETVR